MSDRTPRTREELSRAKRALLEQRLAKIRGARPASRVIPRRSDLGPAPLSAGQERLWFLQQWVPDSAFYNLPFALRIRGPLDAAALDGALDALRQRHTILRTVFREVDGRPAQIEQDLTGPVLQIVDLRELAAGRREAVATSLAVRTSKGGFDLENGPIFRSLLLRLDAELHLLVLSVHHIAADGASVSVILHELQVGYRSRVSGQPAELPELSIQYADFAAWDRQRVSAGDLTERLDHWRQVLAAPRSVLRLPEDRPRPRSFGYRGSHEGFALSPELTAGLTQLAQAGSATLFMALLAAYATLLYRYSGQSDLVIGVPMANRDRPELEPAVGLFLNTLPIRVDLSGEPGFDAVLGRVREQMLEALAHQVPFERVVEALRPEREPSRTPIFQAMFSFQNHPPGTLSLPGLAVEEQEVDTGTVKCDLNLFVAAGANGMSGSLEYSTELFDRETILGMLQSWQRLLVALVEAPQVPISKLPLRDGGRELVGPSASLGAPLLHEGFRDQASRTPDAVAAVFEGKHLSYATLERRSDELARRLRALGVGPDVCVGLRVDRSLSLLVGVLGILKAGGVYLPLDPSYPPARRALMLERSGAGIVLVGPDVTWTPPDGVQVVRTNERGSPDVSLDVVIHPENLAYVVFTSGSTGVPKGIGMTHRAIANLMSWQRRRFGVPRTVLQFSSPSFDVSIQEMFSTWWDGGRLVLVSREERRDPTAVWRRLHDDGVERLFAPFAAIEQLAAAADGGAEQSPSLIEAITAGEQLQLTDAVRRVFDGQRRTLENQYGPAETHVVTAYRLGPAEVEATLPPIGGPIANSRAVVWDRNGVLQVPGIPGELLLGGDSLARGYLHAPGRTAERFVPDPIGVTPGVRLYRTGDRVRERPGGVLDFLGRFDQQVKVRGYRIEPGEIEALLRRHEAVAEAAVVATRRASGDELLAYVVGAAGHVPTASMLRPFLEENLPRFMVPSAYVVLPSLPLTPSGKIDRASLPNLEAIDRGQHSSEPSEPSGPTEEILAAIWSDLLGVPRVGVHDGFFDLGGHSLLAMKVIARTRQALGVELSVNTLFEHPTVAALARQVEELSASERAHRPPLEPALDRTALSFAQQRLWFLQQLDPDSVDYNLSLSTRLLGPLAAEALERALRGCLARHDSLRSRIVDVDGRPENRFDAPSRVALGVIDLSELSSDQRVVQVDRIRNADAHRPFDLAEGPLVRMHLLRCAEQEHIAVLDQHHAVSDGWSVQIFQRELGTLYSAFARNEEPVLQPLPLQYADYARWQRSWLAGDTLEAHLSYWRRQLDGAPALSLPSDAPRQALRGGRAGSHSRTMAAGRLRALARAEDVTPFTLLLSAFGILLGRLAGQFDVSIGCPVAGRDLPQLESLIGLFVNTLVLRIRFDPGAAFQDVLADVRAVVLGAFAHGHVPFEKLVEELRPERDLTRTPLFQVMFNYIREEAGAPEFSGLEATDLDALQLPSKFDVTLYAVEEGPQLDLTLVYNADLFGEDRMRELLDQLVGLVEVATSDPGRSVDTISLVTERARAHLPDPTAPLTPRWSPHGLSLPARLADIARREPHRMAVADRNGSWTWAEVDRRAGAVAQRLRDAGVGAGDVVAVYATREAGLVAVLHGVLRIGAAFVVLSPDEPRFYQADKVARSGAVVLCGTSPKGGLPKVDIPALPWTETELEAASPPTEGPDDDPVAWVSFTSGSTGCPKGIVGTVAPLVHFLQWSAERFGFSGSTRFAMLSGLAHDPLLRDVFLPLWVGGTLYMPAREGLRSPRRLAQWLAEERVNVVHWTPALARVVCGALAETDQYLPDLEVAFFGGDVLTTHLAETLREVAPNVEIVNFYGTTETPQAASWHPWSPALRPAPAAVPIGRGIDGFQLLVLGTGDGLAGVGEVGEIVVRTRFLAKGYLEDPVATAARFQADPNPGEGPTRWYRTGDLGRYRPDGTVAFVGRSDAQLNLRGNRVEPEEVEAALLEHEAVREAAVVARTAASGDQVLVGLVVGHYSVSTLALRRFLKARLPPAMIPSRFAAVEVLPRTGSGKLDRRALAGLGIQAEAEQRAARRPVTPIERALAEIWCEELGVASVDLGDNFFDLGGHSLQALVLIDRIERRLGVRLRPRDLFTHTVHQLASRCAEAGARPT